MTSPAGRVPARSTRRQFIAGGAGLALLAACGRSGQSATGSAGGEAFRVLDTGRGRVTLRKKPGRVVTLGYEASVVLELGVVPVGMAKDFFDPSGIAPYNRQAVAGKDVVLIDIEGGLPFEQIAALKPDVILAGAYDEIDSTYDRLVQLAPAR